MTFSTHNKAIIALIIANTIWGAAAPIFKWSLAGIDLFTLAFSRFFLAALILLPFTFKNLFVAKKDYLNLILLSILGITVNISLFFLGVRLTDSINAPVIGSSASVFIILGSVIFLSEKPKIKVIAGTLLSLIGVLAIIVNPLLQNGGQSNQDLTTSILGNILILGAVFGTVGHTLLLRPISKNYSPLTITFWSFLIGAITFFPLMIFESQANGFMTNINNQGIIGILFGAILSSALAYTLYNYALKYIVANEVGIFFYIDPLIAILIAMPLLGETISFPFLIGSILVFAGISIAEGRIHYHPLHLLKRQ